MCGCSRVDLPFAVSCHASYCRGFQGMSPATQELIMAAKLMCFLLMEVSF